MRATLPRCGPFSARPSSRYVSLRISILEGKASRNAKIAFGVENGVKPCSLETIKQIFTRSKKKKITPAQTPQVFSNLAGSFRMNIVILREFSLDMNIILY
jgi:hypothetical protein